MFDALLGAQAVFSAVVGVVALLARKFSMVWPVPPETMTVHCSAAVVLKPGGGVPTPAPGVQLTSPPAGVRPAVQKSTTGTGPLCTPFGPVLTEMRKLTCVPEATVVVAAVVPQTAGAVPVQTTLVTEVDA
jgi:hypothetical protein